MNRMWLRFAPLGVDPHHAFTFTLVNTLVSDQFPESLREQQALWNVFQAVRKDGRGEDDVIVLGNFGAAASKLNGLMMSHDVTWAVVEPATNVDRDEQSVNVFFSRSATIEFTGRECKGPGSRPESVHGPGQAAHAFPAGMGRVLDPRRRSALGVVSGRMPARF